MPPGPWPTVTLAHLDLRRHTGAHPRLGVLDVVPFAPYEQGRPAPQDLTAAVTQRDQFARWLGEEMGVPTFLYGPLPGGGTRTLPELRRLAFAPAARRVAARLGSGAGRLPPRRHRRGRPAGSWWPTTSGSPRPRWPDAVAPLVRSPEVRALGLAVGDRAQVSCNLVDPDRYGPGPLYDAVAELVGEAGGRVEGGELVGLIPESVLATVPPDRRGELGLSEEATVESRLPTTR